MEKVIVDDEREDIRLVEDRYGHDEVFDVKFEKTNDLAGKVIVIAGDVARGTDPQAGDRASKSAVALPAA